MASGTHYWQRETFNAIPNGMTGLTLDDHISFHATNLGDSLLRTILDIEFFVTTAGTGTGVKPEWWQEVFVMVGVWWDNELTPPTISPTPIADPLFLPDWVLWNRLTAKVDIYDISTPYESVSWHNPTGQIDVLGKRTDFAKNGSRVWLAYEIFDGTSTINQTISGISYNLGVNATLSCLFKAAV